MWIANLFIYLFIYFTFYKNVGFSVGQIVDWDGILVSSFRCWIVASLPFYPIGILKLIDGICVLQIFVPQF